jgi:hypothetical protein
MRMTLNIEMIDVLLMKITAQHYISNINQYRIRIVLKLAQFHNVNKNSKY